MSQYVTLLHNGATHEPPNMEIAMSVPAILYVHPRVRGALTSTQADAADYISRRIGNPHVSLPTRIAENRVKSFSAVPPAHVIASHGAI